MTTKRKPEASRKLTIEEIGALSPEEWKALRKSEKQRFNDFMNRENLPSPSEFYGYDQEDAFSPGQGDEPDYFERLSKEEQDEIKKFEK